MGVNKTLLAEYLSPIGKIRIEAQGGALVALTLEGQRFQRFAQNISRSAVNPIAVQTEKKAIVQTENQYVINQTKRWLQSYFSGKNPETEEIDFPPLCLHGSEFQKLVWRRLLKIPYGTSVTYGILAREIASLQGGRMSAQAIGGAVGANPIAIIVPCHRVLGANGALTGYQGGLNYKRALLQLERIPYKE